MRALSSSGKKSFTGTGTGTASRFLVHGGTLVNVEQGLRTVGSEGCWAFGPSTNVLCYFVFILGQEVILRGGFESLAGLLWFWFKVRDDE